MDVWRVIRHLKGGMDSPSRVKGHAQGVVSFWDRLRHLCALSRRGQLSLPTARKCVNIITIRTTFGSNENFQVIVERVDCFPLFSFYICLKIRGGITAKQWKLEANASALGLFARRPHFSPQVGIHHLWNHLNLLWSWILQKAYYPSLPHSCSSALPWPALI